MTKETIISQVQIKRKNRRLLITKARAEDNSIFYVINTKVLVENTRTVLENNISISLQTYNNIILAFGLLGVEHTLEKEPIKVSMFGDVNGKIRSFKLDYNQ